MFNFLLYIYFPEYKIFTGVILVLQLLISHLVAAPVGMFAKDSVIGSGNIELDNTRKYHEFSSMFKYMSDRKSILQRKEVTLDMINNDVVAGQSSNDTEIDIDLDNHSGISDHVQDMHNAKKVPTVKEHRWYNPCYQMRTFDKRTINDSSGRYSGYDEISSGSGDDMKGDMQEQLEMNILEELLRKSILMFKHTQQLLNSLKNKYVSVKFVYGCASIQNFKH